MCEINTKGINFATNLATSVKEEKMLVYHSHKLRRCTKCILPETMPYISFDSKGICNYCHNYKPNNCPKSREELLEILTPYREKSGAEVLVPFSGGRDSSYGLYLIAEELKMKAIAYTYDWGMITDLAHRNISRICTELGVHNIVVTADKSRKRKNIALNLAAWLKTPDLGMLNILTAGDKHFFRHIETVKKETGVNLNMWSISPLEATHFKAGFLGIAPDFDRQSVYTSGWKKQMYYQKQRFSAMLRSPGYFNSSLIDTLSGEYWRSVRKKKDYFHIFDYFRWDEKIINDTLIRFNWEKATDTTTTWRIGDGTTAFYDYIYYTVAGFTEHDTFRSNQVREGDLTREEALSLVSEENRPRYTSIKWYFDVIGMSFEDSMSIINRIPKLYEY
ncbi:MAG: hypothetical protein LBC96_10310 [Lachnospiraceae bacterium]|jgi:hypothetical protein|nr:hypothetical protein [Lachnospiraceae bacterium]